MLAFCSIYVAHYCCSGCIDADGNVYTWGYGAFWQLGTSKNADQGQPQQVHQVLQHMFILHRKSIAMSPHFLLPCVYTRQVGSSAAQDCGTQNLVKSCSTCVRTHQAPHSRCLGCISARLTTRHSNPADFACQLPVTAPGTSHQHLLLLQTGSTGSQRRSGSHGGSPHCGSRASWDSVNMGQQPSWRPGFGYWHQQRCP